MNFACALILDKMEQLKKTMSNPTSQQKELINSIEQDVRQEGEFYQVEALTLDLMREHGYNVMEEDSGDIESIAEKIILNQDELWQAVEIWAKNYGLEQSIDELDLEESEDEDD